MTQNKDNKPKPRRVRGTGIYSDDEFTFKPSEQREPTQLNVKTSKGAKSWETTGSDPSRMICLKTKMSAPDQFAELTEQFNALTRDLKPKKSLTPPEEQRVVNEDGLQFWLSEQKGELTFTGKVDLSRHPRDWQAEVLRQVQLVVRRLPASDRFCQTIKKYTNPSNKK